MGIDLARICNHNMKFSNEADFVANLSKGFKCEVFPTYVVESKSSCKEGFLYLEDSDLRTVQEYINNRELITMYRAGSNYCYSFYINPYCLENMAEQFYIGRWHDVKRMADHVHEYGFPDRADYNGDNGDFSFINRKKYFDFINTIGGTQSIIFCDDHHPDWLDFFADNYTLDDFIAWGKREFIFVEFKDLDRFTFPDTAPDYYNVFILDGFEDLRAMQDMGG